MSKWYKTILEERIGIDNIVLTAITKIELLAGAINKADIIKIGAYLNRYNILLINDDFTLKAFSLIERYTLSHGLTLADSIIAATAIEANLELFTYNTKDFKFINGLSLFKP